MICWYCYWGWAKKVREIYNKYKAIVGIDNMQNGPAHIVWEDENFAREHVQWCLDNFDKYKREESTIEEHEAVRQSLLELLALPDEILDCEPDDYDGEHPENYPPRIEMM